MANQAIQLTQKSPQVDVLLTWSDFVYSLETLKNKSYSSKCHQRDWFRLNPLDIVLLGCKTIESKMQARRKISHTLVGIEDISSEIKRKPRILEHVILSLKEVLQYTDVASPVVQLCCSALAGIYEALLQCTKLKGICAHWYVVAIIPILVKLIDCEHVTENPTTRVKVKWLIDTAQKLQKKSSVEQLVIICDNHPVNSILNVIRGDCDEILLLMEDIVNLNFGTKFFDLVSRAESFLKILSHLKYGDVECNNGVRILLHIIQVVFIQLACYEDLSQAEDTNQKNGKPDPTLEISTPVFTPVDVDELIALFLLLLEKIERHMDEWNSINAQKSCVPSKILELVFVGLSSQNLDGSLRSTLAFFGDPLKLLMVYANEGYLTKDSTSLFIGILDFICCAIEVDLQLEDVITNFIPNLFGPVFGVRDGGVLCKVLEFGKLALKSRHRKKLLWEGITCIIKVYKLFQPIQVKRSIEQKFAGKVEAVKVALDILDDVIKKCIVLATSNSSRDNNAAWTSEDFVQDVKKQYSEDDPTELINQDSFCTADEVTNDQEIRVEILLNLFELANCLTASGNDIMYIFACVLPRVFLPVPLLRRVGDENVARIIGYVGEHSTEGFIPWDVDRRSFAVALLALCAAAEQNGACRAFQLCAVVLPKLVKNVDAIEHSDDKKMQFIEDIYKLIHENLRAGHDIDVLVSHGIPLMSQLLPINASGDEMRIFLEQMAKQLTKPSFSSVLLLVSNACDFMMTNFSQDTLKIQRLFLHLLKKGKRDDVRNIAKLCNQTICESRLEFVRTYLYSYAVGGLTSRQLAELSEILVAVNGLSIRNHLFVQDEDITGENLARRRIIKGLTDTIVKNLEVILESNTFDKTAWSDLHKSITKISVCVPLLTSDELASAKRGEEESFDLDLFIRRKFPSDILQDSQLMSEIGTISRRIQVMQTPRYDSLKELVVLSLNVFLTSNKSEESQCTNGEQERNVNTSHDKIEDVMEKKVPVIQVPSDQKGYKQTLRENEICDEKTMQPLRVSQPSGNHVMLNEFEEDGDGEDSQSNSNSNSLLFGKGNKIRENRLAEYFICLPRNMEIRERLIKFRYSTRLWEEKPTVEVTTNGTRCVEANLRDNLAACFTGYQNLLRELGIARVDVNGVVLEVDDLFDTTISSVAELKGRRAIATKLIDKHISRQNDLTLLDRKNVLLATEDVIEEKFEEEACKPCKPITFTACVNTSFFDCARCCGAKIVGCYAPSGVHCERPLEIGIRQDSGFASIYGEDGDEIENCELLFTNQGVYVFRGYTNSHPYDTSQVWIKLFTVLLAGPYPYVPAVIVPHLHPNVTTWNTLRRQMPVELTGTVLSCDFDFSVEWQTYYDYKPECVRGGKDIVLKPGFDISHSEKTSAFLERQLSVGNKDLGGLIFERVMYKLCQNDFLKQFRFLGTHISAFINNFLENGYETPSILSEHFDYERWLVKSKRLSSTEAPSKDDIVKCLTVLVEESISSFSTVDDFKEMFWDKRQQFFQLKAFFLAKKRLGDESVKKYVGEINKILRENCEMVLIHKLEQSLQEEIIHWIFRNEDRVWRYRGGRDGHETLEQFMNFLGNAKHPYEKSFPGVVVFVRRNSKNLQPTTIPFGVRDVVAYAVGEYGEKNEESDAEENGEGDEEEYNEQLTEIKDQVYEVVTAWVHPRYRRLNLGIEMYTEVCRHICTPFMTCDILENSWGKIVRSSSLFGFLDRVGLLSWFVRYRRRSYQVITESGEEEQFEKIVIRRNFLRVLIKLHDWYMIANRRVPHTMILFGLSSACAAIAAGYCYFK